MRRFLVIMLLLSGTSIADDIVSYEPDGELLELLGAVDDMEIFLTESVWDDTLWEANIEEK